MDMSIFLKRIGRRFPVPMLAIEYFSTYISARLTDEEVNEHIAYIVERICGVKSPGEDDLHYLLSRLKEAQELDKKENGANPVDTQQKKSFGYALNSWLGDTTPVGLLGEMTQYNMGVMQELYCKSDFTDLQFLLKSYVQGIQARALINYESALYAAGGRYSGDKGSGDNVRRFDANTKEGLAAMRSFGFGSISLDSLGPDMQVN